MAGAMEEVRAGRLTIKQAAVRFGVPKSSLSDRVSGKVAFDCGHGQRPLLSTTEEDALVEYCLYSTSYGFPLTKPQVLATPWASTTSATQRLPGWHLARRGGSTSESDTLNALLERRPIEDYFRL